MSEESTPVEHEGLTKAIASLKDPANSTSVCMSGAVTQLLTAYEAQAAELERLRTENNDLRAIPWPRAYVLERASEWTRLLREVHGYIKTCRGSCGSDMSGRDHAIAAADTLIAMLSEGRALSDTPPEKNGTSDE